MHEPRAVDKLDLENRAHPQFGCHVRCHRRAAPLGRPKAEDYQYPSITAQTTG